MNETLAKTMARDGEGATALFECKVIHTEIKRGCDFKQIRHHLQSDQGSHLRSDANWGPDSAHWAIPGVQLDPEKVDLYFESAAGRLGIIENGVDTGYSEEEATKILSEKSSASPLRI